MSFKILAPKICSLPSLDEIIRKEKSAPSTILSTTMWHQHLPYSSPSSSHTPSTSYHALLIHSGPSVTVALALIISHLEFSAASSISSSLVSPTPYELVHSPQKYQEDPSKPQLRM